MFKSYKDVDFRVSHIIERNQSVDQIGHNMAMKIVAKKDELTKKAVKEFYGIDDPYLAVSRVARMADNWGRERFIDGETGEAIIEFDNHQSRIASGGLADYCVALIKAKVNSKIAHAFKD